MSGTSVREVGSAQNRNAPEGTFYVASPLGWPATRFRLTESSDSRAIFENPEHDFPQRISYWRAEYGSLHARIEGLQNGRPDAREFVWQRAELKTE